MANAQIIKALDMLEANSAKLTEQQRINAAGRVKGMDVSMVPDAGDYMTLWQEGNHSMRSMSQEQFAAWISATRARCAA